MYANKWIKGSAGWYYLGVSGAMATNSWVWSSGKCYYLTESGLMAASTVVDGKYYVDANGAWDGKTITKPAESTGSTTTTTTTGGTTTTTTASGVRAPKLPWGEAVEDLGAKGLKLVLKNDDGKKLLTTGKTMYQNQWVRFGNVYYHSDQYGYIQPNATIDGFKLDAMGAYLALPANYHKTKPANSKSGHWTNVITRPAWDEEIYRKALVAQDGKAFFAPDGGDYVTTTDLIMTVTYYSLANGLNGSYSVENVLYKTIHHDAITEQFWVED